MKTITVQVRENHLETVAKSKPMTAIAELIWNALDAEATEVNVRFQLNELEGLEAIQIADNGTGLHYDDGIMVFQSLGGSWETPERPDPRVEARTPRQIQQGPIPRLYPGPERDLVLRL